LAAQAGAATGLEVLPGAGQHVVLVRDDVLVFDAVIGEAHTLQVAAVQEAVVKQRVGAEQVGVAREGRQRLVGGIAVAGRAERQHLPPLLAGADQGIDPGVGRGAEVADAEWAGQRGRVQEDAGRAVVRERTQFFHGASFPWDLMKSGPRKDTEETRKKAEKLSAFFRLSSVSFRGPFFKPLDLRID